MDSESISPQDEIVEQSGNTEVIYGAENIIDYAIRGIPLAKKSMDLCGEEAGPTAIVANEPILQEYIEARNRGVRIRLITEITKNNLSNCKQLMKCMDLRHLDGLYGYFVIQDGERFNSHAFSEEVKSFPHMITSTEKMFVMQQQYFFNTLWEKAIPAEYRIKEIEEGVGREITEVVTGWENIFRKNTENLSLESGSIMSCCDRQVIPIIVASPMYEASAEFVKRGGKIRILTEITTGNLSSVKQMLKISEIRHINDFGLNFGVSDNVFNAPTSVYSSSKLPQCIFSNSKELIAEHQYLFENLWGQAIPAESRIQEIERGTEPERTEVWRDPEVIISRSLGVLNKVSQKYDFCVDWKGPSIIMTLDYVRKAYLDIVARGGKLRLITEIVPENIKFCYEIMDFIEIRHLDGIKGNFGIVDEKIYGGTAHTDEYRAPTAYLYSTVKEFVEQQQYLFETLWEKGFPARERIRELEEGRQPNKIELIHDSQKSISRAFNVMHNTREELLVLFATSHTFSLALDNGAAEIYRQVSETGTKVKILVPTGKDVEGLIVRAKSGAPLIDLKISNENLSTRLTIMISDRKVLMSWELRDETSSDPYEAGGLATYANFETIASSYAVIFDNLWTSTEFAESLKTANEKLESKEKAMEEFINVAAHELRTPIQPILGLSEVLRDRSKDMGNETELVDAIIRNAKRLAGLQEDILDVTRIESNLLKLIKTSFSIDVLVKEAIAMFEADEFDLYHSEGVNFKFDSILDGNSLIEADRNRIGQVITNLISNSLKFMNEGTVQINARLTDDKKMVFLSVKDSGIGIDKEIMPKLFTKFASKSAKGTGLGLYICKSIIEAHGGRIWGANNEGFRGATFSFTLPVKPN